MAAEVRTIDELQTVVDVRIFGKDVVQQ